MSTDNAPRATLRATMCVALLAGFALTGCLARHPSRTLADVCQGRTVGASLSLVIDSLGRGASPGLHRLQGQRFAVTLTLANPLSAERCEDRSGDAYVNRDALPDALAGATGNHGGKWMVQGTRVAVNLNPGVFDNNLQFDLPLDGAAGTWSLSTFAGRVAWGRLLPTER